ncbi:MAG: DUF1207 domain-containing protein [Elusimicrobia bacterium]|nr:DUF1207 domain-containing protein [Elusimicrobiota bacterium]
MKTIVRSPGSRAVGKFLLSRVLRAGAAGFLLALGALSLRGEESSRYATGNAPPPDGLFAPLRADPRELHFALRAAFPHQRVTAAEVAIGHYYGIYRWALPGGAGAVQANVGGGIFPRFNFSHDTDLQVIDFYGNIPVDVRAGRWSGRFMVYHVSSHLGDDYIRATGHASVRNSWNTLRSILSFDADPRLRLYGGHSYHLLVRPAALKGQAFQAGVEIYSPVFANGRAQAYWANDAQWWQRTHWRTMYNAQVGIKLGRDRGQGRGISYFLEFTTGPEHYGQFFDRSETRGTVGAKFDFI